MNPVLDVARYRAGCAGVPARSCRRTTRSSAAIMRFSAIAIGRFSSRLIVGCEHRSSTVFLDNRPTAILKAGSASRRRSRCSSGYPALRSAIHDTDHLGHSVPHPVRSRGFFEARSPSVRHLERVVRSPPSAISRHPSSAGRHQPDMHRLTRHRWQTTAKSPYLPPWRVPTPLLRFDPALATKSYTKPTVYAAPAVPWPVQ